MRMVIYKNPPVNQTAVTRSNNKIPYIKYPYTAHRASDSCRAGGRVNINNNSSTTPDPGTIGASNTQTTPQNTTQINSAVKYVSPPQNAKNTVVTPALKIIKIK